MFVAGSRSEARSELRTRLLARREEIESAILTRVYDVSDPAGVSDPAYAEGLRGAVAVAIDYGLAGITRAEGSEPAIPAALLVQARIAARSGVSLDTVLRRCIGGYVVFGRFVLEEAQEDDIIAGASLKQLLGTQASQFDQLLVAVSEEHGREAGERLDTLEHRRYALVRRLLAGEQFDHPELSYDLDAVHLGVSVAGAEGAEALELLGQVLDRRLLSVCRGDGTVDAWLGGQRDIDTGTLARVVSSDWPFSVSLAVGEPARGLAGWRLTHRQARAALTIARRSGEALIRYRDAALLAAAIQDDLLAAFLRKVLAPLSKEPGGGEVLRQTLRAYFAAGHNASSAAATLGVRRHTVASRLRVIEERLGVGLVSHAAELETALHLESFQGSVIS